MDSEPLSVQGFRHGIAFLIGYMRIMTNVNKVVNIFSMQCVFRRGRLSDGLVCYGSGEAVAAQAAYILND